MTVIKSHGKALPDGMTDDLLMEINKEASKRMIALVAPGVELSHREDLLKLSMGRMFDSVVQRMRQCAEGESKHQMYMYSGHDTTVMPLLATLGQDVSTWPPYVSNVIFELWESQTTDGKKQDYVKVLVNGKEVELPNMLPGMLCSLHATTCYEVYVQQFVGRLYQNALLQGPSGHTWICLQAQLGTLTSALQSCWSCIDIIVALPIVHMFLIY